MVNLMKLMTDQHHGYASFMVTRLCEFALRLCDCHNNEIEIIKPPKFAVGADSKEKIKKSGGSSSKDRDLGKFETEVVYLTCKEKIHYC